MLSDALAAASKLDDPARQAAYEAALAGAVAAGDVGGLTGFAEHGAGRREGRERSRRSALELREKRGGGRALACWPPPNLR